MKKILFLQFSLLWVAMQCFSQDWVNLLNYPLSRSPTQMQFLKDGDLFICGAIGPKQTYATHTAMLTRMHPDGSVVWTKQLGNVDPDGNFTHEERLEDLAVTEDGHIVAVGYRNVIQGGPFFQTDVLVVKTDLEGNVIWKRYLDWGPSDNGMGIATLADGSLAICGNSLSLLDGDYKAFVLKMSAGGQVAWKKEYNLAAQEDWLYKIIRTRDQKLVAAGTSQLPGVGNRMLAVKLDTAGNTLWQKTYDEYAIRAKSVVEGPNGRLGFGGLGYQSLGGLDNLILETDANGNVKWERNYHVSTSAVPDEVYDLLPCAEGGYVAVGMSGENPFDGYHVLHVGGNGDTLHTFTLFDGGSNIEWAVSLAHAPDGAILVAGNRQNDAWDFDLILSQYSGLGCTALQTVETHTLPVPQYSVFPNPADAFFSVKMPEHSGQIAHLSLIDMAGRQVGDWFAATDELRAPCRHLPEGVYSYLLALGGGQVVSGKILIKH